MWLESQLWVRILCLRHRIAGDRSMVEQNSIHVNLRIYCKYEWNSWWTDCTIESHIWVPHFWCCPVTRSDRQSTWTQQLSVRSNWPDPTQPKVIFWLSLVCVLVGFTSTFRNPHEILVGLGLVWFRVPKLHLDTQLTFKHMYMHCIILG